MIAGTAAVASWIPARRATQVDPIVTLTAAGPPAVQALIGRELYPLLTEAGFASIRVSPRMVYVDGSRPELADRFTRKTFTAMIEGVREQAIETGLTDAAKFDEGIRALYRAAADDGVFCYTFFKGVGIH